MTFVTACKQDYGNFVHRKQGTCPWKNTFFFFGKSRRELENVFPFYENWFLNDLIWSRIIIIIIIIKLYLEIGKSIIGIWSHTFVYSNITHYYLISPRVIILVTKLLTSNYRNKFDNPCKALANSTNGSKKKITKIWVKTTKKYYSAIRIVLYNKIICTLNTKS